jgi:hypothetical protein
VPQVRRLISCHSLHDYLFPPPVSIARDRENASQNRTPVSYFVSLVRVRAFGEGVFAAGVKD